MVTPKEPKEPKEGDTRTTELLQDRCRLKHLVKQFLQLKLK